MRERGLKSYHQELSLSDESVAPHAGAWIEIAYLKFHSHFVSIVAPHAGAWIEMSNENFATNQNTLSLPMRERGLKSPLIEFD